MEPFIEYFSLVFKGAFPCLLIGIVVFLLAKRGKIWSDSLQTKKLVESSKKAIVFCLIIILAYLLLKFSFPDAFRKKLYHSKEEYKQACMNDAKKSSLPDSIKVAFINNSFDYLYSKYGDNMYYADFKYKMEDEIKMKLDLYFLKNPGMNDSIKQAIRSKIKTKNDLDKFIRLH